MIDFNIEKIVKPCESFGVILDKEKTEKLNFYADFLIEQNKKVNLTSITDADGVLYKHFYDCLLFLKHCNPEKGASLIDVGTGAGFPGAVLKIARPDLKVTLLDSLNKRLVFLNELIEKLRLTGIETVHMRAEEAGKSPLYREKYDIAAARAVASLPVLLEYCTPLVKPRGVFVAMKGPNIYEEAKLSAGAEKALCLEKPKIICETLTGNEQRTFAVYKKISQTLPKYPRKPADISKQPL